MQDYPHRYSVIASGGADHEVALESEGLPHLESAAPAQFGGPGDRWSPETLLVAAVADCFVLTFRAVARASKLPWTSLACEATGTLDRVQRVVQFTHLAVRARLTVPTEVGEDQARAALERAERGCLITNSLKATVQFDAEVVRATQPDAPPKEWAATRD